MTPILLIEVNNIESRHRYQHHSRPQVRHQDDPYSNESPKSYEFCNSC